MQKDQKTIHLEKSIKTFSYTFGGTILPLIIALFAMLLLNRNSEFWKFLDKGDVLIFSAGLYSTAWFLFSENSTSVRDKKDKILWNLSILFLIICSALYAIVYSVSITQNSETILNIGFLRTVSCILFAISTIAVWRSIFIDQKKFPSPDIQASSASGVSDIMDQL